MRRTPALALPLALVACANENLFFAQKGLDTFEQVPNDQVDILFVVDESNSMAEEQATLAAGFQSFITELEGAGANFHIGVVSTSQETDDPDRGKLIGDPLFLTPSDDYVRLFQERVQLGIGGSDKEKGLQAAAFALAPENLVQYNIGFLRPDANLLVVIVSDEEDCSDDGALDGREAIDCYKHEEELVPVKELVNRIHDSKNNGEMVQLGAIIGPQPGYCDTSFPGYRYMEAVGITGGVLSNICNDDWSVVLQELGLNALGIRDTFTLSNPANPATLEVMVDETEVPEDEANGWTYNWQYSAITFHGDAVPPRGSVITVTYDIASMVQL